MKNVTLVTVIIFSTMSMSACQTGNGQNEQSGVVIGALLGGLIGNELGGGSGRTAAVIVGTLVGSQIGGNVGRSMDDTDRLITARSLETVRTGVSTSWKNPDTGNQYSVTPTRTYSKSTGPCRDYTINASIGAKNQEVYGVACRQADGSWKTQS